MKSSFVWLIFAFYCTTVHTSCSTWTERMKKYGGLIGCKYYVTSEAKYIDFIPYHRNENDTGVTHVMKIRFSTLSKTTIRVRLAANNDPIPDYPTTTTTAYPTTTTSRYPHTTTSRYPDTTTSGYPTTTSRYPTTTSRYPTTTPRYPHTTKSRYPGTTTSGYPTTTPRYPYPPSSNIMPDNTEMYQNPIGYEIVIGSVVERIIYQNNKYYLNNYVESYIQTNGNRIRSLSTPGIVRDDEPNDVVIEIFTDGLLNVTVNGIGALHAHIDKPQQLQYFSFASSKDQLREEFFYYCHN